ncbi:hypothetical protein GLOIN_2v1523116 [Rhizophagus irregularis DAOM 181602=DAOM 197198]|nr:hypothetical protein GLOIN_2v1523116 [Rhizophagus irregularis DAOM 181602=DAOM 197198]
MNSILVCVLGQPMKQEEKLVDQSDLEVSLVYFGRIAKRLFGMKKVEKFYDDFISQPGYYAMSTLSLKSRTCEATIWLAFSPSKSETSNKSKLDKFLAGENITLNCFISGEGVNNIFDVETPDANNNQVSSMDVLCNLKNSPITKLSSGVSLIPSTKIHLGVSSLR